MISERIMALRLIKMLGQEDRETRNVTEVVTRFGNVLARIAILGGVVEITIDPLQMLTLFAVIYVGVQFFHASLATIGLFLFILLQLNNNTKLFNNGRQLLSANIDSLRAVRDTLDRAKASRLIIGGSARVHSAARRHPFRGRELRLRRRNRGARTQGRRSGHSVPVTDGHRR